MTQLAKYEAARAALRRWRMVRRLPWVLLALWMMSLLTSVWRGPG